LAGEVDALPSALAHAFLPASGPSEPVACASASYRLYGLAAGTWTIRAAGPGFLSTSSVLYVAQEGDIGDPATGSGGLELSLGLGEALTGTVTVRAAAAQLPDPRVVLEIYEPRTARLERTPVALSTGVTQASGTFSLGGLEPGTYWVNAFLKGFEATTMGKAPERVRQVKAGGRKVWVYRHGYPVDLGDPSAPPAGAPALASEEFCVIPLGGKFFVLSFAHESPIPDPEAAGEKAWAALLASFSLKAK